MATRKTREEVLAVLKAKLDEVGVTLPDVFDETVEFEELRGLDDLSGVSGNVEEAVLGSMLADPPEFDDFETVADYLGWLMPHVDALPEVEAAAGASAG